MLYKRIRFIVIDFLKSCAKYTEKQIIIVVQATPKTQPGGVHGA
tara:strand:+ start:1747 stop:1878 length:132 start_codon:yes stop_codon:yes gene_type:complete